MWVRVGVHGGQQPATGLGHMGTPPPAHRQTCLKTLPSRTTFRAVKTPVFSTDFWSKECDHNKLIVYLHPQ